MTVSISPNFACLASREPLLAQLGTLAEKFFADDPNTALLKLRQFAEKLAERVGVHVGLAKFEREQQIDYLERLGQRGVLPTSIANAFHFIRKTGNRAVHDNAGTQREALVCLQAAHQLALWFHRTFHKPASFTPPPFVPPPDPMVAAAQARAQEQEFARLRQELAKLREELADHKNTAQAAKAAAAAAALEKLGAEEKLAKLQEERRALEAAAKEAEAKFAASVESARHVAPPSEKEIAGFVQAALTAAGQFELDEAATRALIDEQLRRAGWEVDTERLRHSLGVRPVKGKNRAIAEWPTDKGPADYVLFRGLEPLAVVEAKKKRKNVANAVEQAGRYAEAFTFEDGLTAPGGPWGKYKIPFLFATNGRPYLRQLEQLSGIWFRDARKKTNHARALNDWYTPDGLAALLAQDVAAADAQLKDEPTDYLGLRDYQIAAIRAVEDAIAKGQRSCLLAMATGTGKTRTCIGLAYRLLKTKRFRRILFVVDRKALGVQAQDALKTTTLEGLQTFAQLFDVKELEDVQPDPDTKLHVATIQGLIARLYAPIRQKPEYDVRPTVDQYDCVIVDECHRGYQLDQELSDDELTFRDETDFISQYRRVLDHLDAVKIGLSATPALHTREIFGDPVYQYTYREAVLDHWLVDHELPIEITTKLAKDGIHWTAGQKVHAVDPADPNYEVKLLDLPDEVKLEIEHFHRKVVVPKFNEAVAGALAKEIDPLAPGKTIVFCVDDKHADLVVGALKKAFDDAYGGVDDDAVKKITAAADKPLALLRRFKNEKLPSVAVTVDLLTTGVDIPEVTNLVFLRRTKSRILYEQMLGRATRLCPAIGKQSFRIFDAVRIYEALEDETNMRPLVTRPTWTLVELVADLKKAKSQRAKTQVHQEIVAKLQRKVDALEKLFAGTFVDVTGGHSPVGFIHEIRRATPQEALRLLETYPQLVALIDEVAAKSPGVTYIAQEDDAVLSVAPHLGQPPKDYLTAFGEFLAANRNRIPALIAVTQRPRDLTRKELRALQLALEHEGFGEKMLQAAYAAVTNHDIAASIVGFIRQQALGDPLVPYAERVDVAVAAVLAKHKLTGQKAEWLRRIAKQLKQEIVVDRAALDAGEFRAQGGGFDRLNKVFGGELPSLLGELADTIWNRTA